MTKRTERCETCKWWERESDDGLESEIGNCCRNPPAIVPYILKQDEFDYPWGSFPMVHFDSFCGEWTSIDAVDKPFPWDKASVRLFNVFDTQTATKPTTMKEMSQFGAGRALELRNCGQLCIEEICRLLDEPWRSLFRKSEI